MIIFKILICVNLCALIASAESEYILFGALVKSTEVLPTVVYPPSGGDNMPEKSLLVTFTTNKVVTEFSLDDNHFDKIYKHAISRGSGTDPFFTKGKNFIVKSPSNVFYLLYYEIESEHNVRRNRFMISKLINLGENEHVLVRCYQGGGVSSDPKILDILQKLDID